MPRFIEVKKNEEEDPLLPDLPAQLRARAGSRGYTFAGRYQPTPPPITNLQPGFSIADVPNLEEQVKYGPLMGGAQATLQAAPPNPGMFDMPQHANAYATSLHNEQEKRTADLRPGPLRRGAYSILGPGSETSKDIMAKTPLGELEAGGYASTAPMDLAAGLALGRFGARGLTRLPELYRGGVQKAGEMALSRVPGVFRSGRGTPLEFREARMQAHTDISNTMEEASKLKQALEIAPWGEPLTGAERGRVSQLMQPSGVGARQPFRDRQTGQWVDPDFEMRVSGAAKPGIVGGREVRPLAPETIDAARKLRGSFLDMQEQLKNYDAISPEIIDRFRNTFGIYFPRMYGEHVLVDKSVARFPTTPMRSGRSGRLLERGEHIEVDIPDLQDEMKQMSRFLGPEEEFRREFKQAARPLTQRRQRVEGETTTERTTTQESRTSQTTEEGVTGATTEIPLSGVGAKLEEMIQGALTARGMTQGEAQAATGRLKAVAAKMAQSGEDVKIATGGTRTERVTETIQQTKQVEKETVKRIIEGLGINNAQRAALHAYYDVITRAAAKKKTVVAGGKTYRLEPVMDVESGLERAASLEPLLKAGFRVTGREGNRVQLFRDIDESVKAALGEMKTEPGYVGARGLSEVGHEVAMRKFFRTVAENPEWARDTHVGAPAYRTPTLRHEMPWTQMPDNPKTLGDLAGKWVRPDIAKEINEAVRSRTDYERINQRLNTLWKLGKVTNLPTIGRNILSSAEMARWGGLYPTTPDGAQSYLDAITGLHGSNPKAAALIAEARKMPVYGSTFNQAELNILSDGYQLSKDPNAVIRFLDGVMNVAQKTGAPELYGSVDHFFKTALYIHARSGRSELGPTVTPQAAARYARKFAIDYEDVSPFIRSMSQVPFGSPFVRFTSKMIPLALETAAKHPVRFFATPAVILGINELSKSALNQNELEEMSQVEKAGQMRAPRFVSLGKPDQEGRYPFLDLGYQLPYGDLIEVFDLMRGGTGANISFEPMGGMWGAAAEIVFNKSKFTKQPIWLETDTPTEAAAKISDHMGKALLPSWAPPVPGTGFRGGYSTEQLRKSFRDYIPERLRQLPGEAPMSPTDWLGRSRSPAEAIAAKVLGIDVRSVSLSDLQRTAMVELNRKWAELSQQASKMQRMDIPNEEKMRIMEGLLLKYQDTAKELEEKFTPDPQAKKRGLSNFMEMFTKQKRFQEVEPQKKQGRFVPVE